MNYTISKNLKTAKSKLKAIFTTIARREILILVSIFLFSLVVRIIGIKHGFPLLTHPDEAVIVDRVFYMTLAKTLNSGNFNRPNQILYSTNFFYLNLLSFIRFGTNLGEAFPKYYLSFYAYARFLISAMGALIPVLAYKIGNEFHKKFGFSAALVFALFPSYVLHSLYVTPDIPITLFTLAVIYFTIRYLKRGNNFSIYLATIFAAITTAEKYPGLITLVIVWTGIIINHFQNHERFKKTMFWPLAIRLVKVSILFIIALFIVAPYIFIEYQQVLEALLRESRTTHLGADGLGWVCNLLFYGQSFISWTNILIILFIGSGIYALIKNKDKSQSILLYGIVYWIVLSVLSLHWERWALPMYITPLFLTAMGISFLLFKVKEHKKLKLIILLSISIFFAVQFVTTLHTSVAMTFSDTREVALNYCNKNGITPENSLFEGYTPFLPGQPIFLSEKELSNEKYFDYIVLSSQMYDRYFAEPERYAEMVAVYENIREKHRLIAEFSPTRPAKTLFDRMDDIIFSIQNHLNLTVEERFTGPTIQIYEFVR